MDAHRWKGEMHIFVALEMGTHNLYREQRVLHGSLTVSPLNQQAEPTTSFVPGGEHHQCGDGIARMMTEMHERTNEPAAGEK